MATLSLPVAPLWIAAMLATVALAIWGAIPSGRTRRVRARSLLRALLPRRILRSRSGRLDIGAFLFSTLVAGTAIGWALVSGNWWAAITERAMASLPVLPFQLSPLPAALVMTGALFVAYEGAYWLNHWMSHRIGWLWAFHKVHHTAESLSLLTNFRVHPVDTIVFYNMAAAIAGVTAGMLKHLIGPSAAEISVSGNNLLVFFTSIILSYLQHSHLWMATTGRWGRWILSPAHHQLHHSTDPRHYNCNLGSTTALFDRLAGTLLAPTAQRQALRFGVEELGYDPHSVRGAVLRPFSDAARAILPVPGETGTTQEQALEHPCSRAFALNPAPEHSLRA
jgi:sterol desaturase/sphingolipid hydroxylase (fatty acid hydroxylase superfamily)